MNKGKKRTDKITNIEEREGDKIGNKSNIKEKRTRTKDDLVSGTSDQIALVCFSP